MTMEAEATLFEVTQALEAEHGIKPTKLEMTYPKKVFQGVEDFSKTLKEAGLVPSAVLRVS
jgi:UBX domain-containing protein 1/4